MEKWLSILSKVSLFEDIPFSDLPLLLPCLGAREVTFQKNEVILQKDHPTHEIGIVLVGQAQVVQEDYYGNRTILTHLEPCSMFAEAFACAEIAALPVIVTAVTPCTILLIDCRKLSQPCAKACGFHSKLIQNLLRILATKNMLLTQKIEITSQRSTRDKLMAYLMLQAQQQRKQHFMIPFNRQALADYLGVERSAMSTELSHMQRDGILRYRKNEFELLTPR